MGAYLSKPEKEKISEADGNEMIRYASSTMQGWRIHQEDAHNCILDFGPNVGMFAVYDGHGGREVAQYLAERFPGYLKKKDLLAKEDIGVELKKAFVDFDATLREEDTVKIMGAMKEADLPTKPEEIEDPEEAERKERETLYEEAIALSKEANVSLDKIIKQYAKCRNALIEAASNANASESSRGNKRGIVTPSPQIMKRRKVNKGDLEEETPNNHAEKEDPAKNGEERPTNNGGLNGETQAEGEEGSTDEQAHAMETTTGKQEEQVAQQNEPLSVQPMQPSSSSSGVKTAENVEETDEDEEDDPDFAPEEEEEEGEQGQTDDEAEEEEVEGEQEEETDEEDEEDEGEEGEEDEDEEGDDELNEEDIGTLLSAAETGTKAGFDSGSTACVAFVFEDRIVVANIGDSRAVLCRAGEAIELSADHKPEDQEEKKRILAAGGKVGEDGRVNGGLNLSRAFGDHFYKQKSELPLQEQMITALPDVTTFKRDEQRDDFLVIACDGIWNSMSSQEACDFVAERIGTRTLQEITEEICEKCCAQDTSGDGSGCDNETVILVDLNKNRPTPQPKISKPSDGGTGQATNAAEQGGQQQKEEESEEAAAGEEEHAAME